MNWNSFYTPERVKAGLAMVKRAREILSTNWIQGAYALDADGNPIGEHSPKATCFCSIGALNRARIDVDRDDTSALTACRNVVEDSLPEDFAASWGKSIIGYNDYQGRTKEEVLQVFDTAIAKMEARLISHPVQETTTP